MSQIKILIWRVPMKILRSKIVKPKNKHKSDIQSAVDETAKYPIKDTDYMTDDEEKTCSVWLI